MMVQRKAQKRQRISKSGIEELYRALVSVECLNERANSSTCRKRCAELERDSERRPFATPAATSAFLACGTCDQDVCRKKCTLQRCQLAHLEDRSLSAALSPSCAR